MQNGKKAVPSQPMRRIRAYLIYLYVCVAALSTLSGCCKDTSSPTLPSVGSPGDTLSRTLIFYLAGENSLSRFVAADSLEISQGLSEVNEDCRVVVLIDDTKSSRLCVGTKQTPLQTVRTYQSNLSMTDSATMLSVLTDIVQTYPASSYGLVFWSHASGWVFQHETPSRQAPRRTFGIDSGRRALADNIGLEMNIPTLRHVLEQLPHFEFLFFDACFMQEIEVAYELRHTADYIIGSPAEIPGDGAPYHLLLKHLCTSPTALEAATDTYVDYYVNGNGAAYYDGAVLSLICTAALEGLAAQTRPLLQTLFAERKELNCWSVQRYCLASRKDLFTDCYDMKNLFYRHIDSEAFAAWDSAFVKAVPLSRLTPYWTTAFSNFPMSVNDPDHCGGVSIFVPDSEFDRLGWTQDYHAMEWYTASGMNQTDW